jgi:hypothetical protein
MPVSIAKYNIRNEEHVETTTAPPAVKFDDKLKEDIPQAGGFFIQNIKRNKSDVYNVNIS